MYLELSSAVRQCKNKSTVISTSENGNEPVLADIQLTCVQSKVTDTLNIWDFN